MSTPFNPLPHQFRNRGWPYQPGDMYYVDDDGIWQAIERPSDWATIPYFLGIDQVTGIPTWMSLSGEVASIVRVGFIASTLQLFPPTITRVVSLPLLGPTVVLYPPLLESIDLPLLASTVVLYPPTVNPSQLVAGGTISGTQLFAPTIVGAQSVTGAFISSTQLFAPVILPNEPWGEVARVTSLSSGRLVMSGLNLSGLKAIQLHVNDVSVTSDDTIVGLRLIIDGTEISTGSYRWAQEWRASDAGAQTTGGSGLAYIPLSSTQSGGAVGNDATEGLDAVVTAFNPVSATQYKRAMVRSSWVQPTGRVAGIDYGGGQLNDLGQITGFVVYGISSDLTAGSLVLLGLE